jgi:hypothetical protein
MKMKNLGKIFILLTTIVNILNASVSASVDSQKVELGEMITLMLKLDGEDIKKPDILSICGEDVISTGSQTSIEMSNGAYNKTNILTFKFLPQKSCTIEPIAVEIDGKTEYTKEINIEVTKQKITKDSKYILSLESSKDEVYIGESFDVTLLFKQRSNTNAVDSKFTPPNLNGFWVKNETQPERYTEGEYTVTKVVYKLSAQREGDLKVSPAQIKIASRVNAQDSWGYLIPKVKWRTYFSNELDIKVKKAPNGVDLVGYFEITSSVDKTSIEKGEAVNLNIKLIGDGNLEDITSLKPDVEGVSVFDEKAVIQNNTLSQKIAFVSDKSFVIPSIELKCFNPNTQEIKTIKTKEYKIDVKGSENIEQKLNIKREDGATEIESDVKTSGKMSVVWGVFIFVVGFISGVFVMILRKVSFSKDEKFDIKDEKKLLVKLLEHKNDPEVKDIIEKLEANIYSGKKEILDKKHLKEVLKRLKIS